MHRRSCSELEKHFLDIISEVVSNPDENEMGFWDQTASKVDVVKEDKNTAETCLYRRKIN